MTYKPIKFDEVFSKELSLLLISGIAGIGKTCLLRKCLLDWASGILWKTVDFVVYFECRKLNFVQNITNINELLKIFYKDIFQECNVCDIFQECNVFQNHICKTDEAVHSMMQSESNKQHVLRVCKVAWELFNQGKILFSQDEMIGIINDFDKFEKELYGFIERVESQLGYQYQFAHLTLMEFCASVHAHIYLSTEEIMGNVKLSSCLPMICGLANENKKSLMRFLPNLKNSNEERNSLLNSVLDLVPKSANPLKIEYKMFIECFFEAQASITEDMKRSIDEREWDVWIIRDGKTAHEISHENYFMEKFFYAGCKLKELHIRKNILSEDEKKLVILCSTNVRYVSLYHPVKFDNWTPKHKIECLLIGIRDTFVSKNEFEGFVLPWIRLAEELDLYLHDDTNFIDAIREWLRGSNFKKLVISYHGEYFYNIEKFCQR